MKTQRWWEWGLAGGLVLSVATFVKVVSTIPRFFKEDVPWSELPAFAASVFGMGFFCGVLVCALLPLSMKLGSLGDAILGILVMMFFFALCMLVFDPGLLFPDPSRGSLLFGFAIVLGALAGYLTGRDLRKSVEE